MKVLLQQRSLFGELEASLKLPASAQISETALPQTDSIDSVPGIKSLIKKLVTENNSDKRSMSRFDLERSVVDLYKSLSKAYGKLHDKLRWILFKGRHKKPILHTAREIRENIIEATKGVSNDKTITARNMAIGWRNLFKASILAAEGLAQEKISWPKDKPL